MFKKRIHVEKNAAPGVGGAMFGNVGMILFLILGCFLMVLVAVAMNHPDLMQGLM